METSNLDRLRKRVAKAPDSPGVYRWLDKDGHVLYVGKAKNLKKRMKHYVQAAKKHSAWTGIMVRQIHDFDVTIVNNELEALMLETNLIKELKPKFNILMKDDKNYVYLKITMNDTFPRIDIVRRLEDDPASSASGRPRGASSALYFGPKTSAYELKETLAFLRSLFPFRNCRMGIELAMSDERRAMKGDAQSSKLKAQSFSKASSVSSLPLEVVCRDRDRPTPCVDYHIKQCLAPCIGIVTPEQYRLQAIDGVVAFFQGKYQQAEQILSARMQDAAREKKFERAAKFRDQLERLKRTQERQLISDTSGANTDTIGVSLLSGRSFVVLLREREGRLIAEESFALQGVAENLSEILGQFIPLYYSSTDDLPETVVVGEVPADRGAVEKWLSDIRGKRVKLHVPERGKKSKLLLLAEKNAESKAMQSEAKWEAETRRTEEALKELQNLLKLPDLPKRIEGYDISHLSGIHTVGSMVVFLNGKPKREHYRSFNIRSVEGKVDDYRSLAEVLRRRLKYLTEDFGDSKKSWEERGIEIGKARKAEQKVIEKTSKAHSDEIGTDAIDYRNYIVARHDKEIVGFCRLFQYPGKVQTIRSLWIKKDWRGGKLGHTLIRTLLRRFTKGKIYVHISDEALLEYYMELGFQPVRTPLPVLQKKLDIWAKAHPGRPAGMILVYIVAQQKTDDSFSEKPDLILIDGGKGQLNAATAVLKEFKLDIPAIGLAKREEEIFVPPSPPAPPPRGEGRKVTSAEYSYGPLKVPQDSAARFLLQRVRDEAHRFANFKREGRAKKSSLHSALDGISGIGDA